MRIWLGAVDVQRHDRNVGSFDLWSPATLASLIFGHGHVAVALCKQTLSKNLYCTYERMYTRPLAYFKTYVLAEWHMGTGHYYQQCTWISTNNANSGTGGGVQVLLANRSKHGSNGYGRWSVCAWVSDWQVSDVKSYLLSVYTQQKLTARFYVTAFSIANCSKPVWANVNAMLNEIICSENKSAG